MTYELEELSLELIEALVPLMPRIKRADRSLADQLLRAANSMVLNIGEAQYSDPGNSRARFSTAAGSANETRSALRLATTWGHLSAAQVERSHRLLDEVMAMLWRLSR